MNFHTNQFQTYISGNDSSFGRPIIYTDTIHNAILSTSTPIMHFQFLKAHSLIGMPYLVIIASNEMHLSL